jgi:phosphoribosyl 1,2-cyclic phosphodiesterase
MRINLLGSGSTGNATLIVDGETRVLIDCGLSARELARRLMEVGETADRLTAIVITHEHSDHIKGLATLAKGLNIDVYISPLAYKAARFTPTQRDLNLAEPISVGVSFEIGSLVFNPVRSPHDCVDPMVFTITARGIKVAVVTDLGYIPLSVAEHLRGCAVLMLEANHDLELLKASAYPWSLKQRVMSRLGHLSNHEMARFLLEDYDGQAKYIVLSHLSRENNHPEIARLAARQALAARTADAPLFAETSAEELLVAHHDRPLGWIEL